MTSAPWTPGPWTVHKSRTTDDVGIIGGGGCLAECFSEIRRKNENAVREQEANAHLIAAAPDLYAALDAIIDGRMWSMSDNKFGAAKAALAKARGQA